MLRQYSPPRQRYQLICGRELAVGAVPVGEIFRYAPTKAARPRTCMVEAWMTRAYARADRTGRFSYLARGGHLALVRDLGNGRQAIGRRHHPPLRRPRPAAALPRLAGCCQI